jgi:hypothetical protein
MCSGGICFCPCGCPFTWFGFEFWCHSDRNVRACANVQWRNLRLPLRLHLPLVLLLNFGVIPTGTFALARMRSGGTCGCPCRCGCTCPCTWFVFWNFGVISTRAGSRSETAQWRNLRLPLRLHLPLVLLLNFGVIPTGTFALARARSGGICFCPCRTRGCRCRCPWFCF